MKSEDEAMESAFQAPYAKRALAESIARAAEPIVILEGPHGVGKTSLVRNEPALRGYHYVTLADEETFARAVREPAQWAASLSRPVVIDDAHRVESLVEAVQQVAPKKLGDAPVFILVASRALNIGGKASPKTEAAVAAAAPVLPEKAARKMKATAEAAAAAERAAKAKKARKPLKPRRFTLFPLTQAELCEREGCIVDDLFDRVPLADYRSTCSRSDLRTMMRIGGFPRYAAQTMCLKPSDRSMRIQEEMRVLLEDGAAPKADIDRSIEISVLKRVLTNPGLSLGIGALAHACFVDAPTVSGLMNAFTDRFLVHRLPGLADKRGRKQIGTRSRVHAIDTTFVIEALRAGGHDIAVNPAMFGKVLHTFCVSQLVPAAQWASEPTECHNWLRYDRRARAVDIVFVREGRWVGVKIRNCTTIRSDNIGALKIMAEDERFARGFIVYMGSLTLQLTENIWAIPVSALWERDAFYPREVDEELENGEEDEEVEEELVELTALAEEDEGIVR